MEWNGMEWNVLVDSIRFDSVSVTATLLVWISMWFKTLVYIYTLSLVEHKTGCLPFRGCLWYQYCDRLENPQRSCQTPIFSLFSITSLQRVLTQTSFFRDPNWYAYAVSCSHVQSIIAAHTLTCRTVERACSLTHLPYQYLSERVWFLSRRS